MELPISGRLYEVSSLQLQAIPRFIVRVISSNPDQAVIGPLEYGVRITHSLADWERMNPVLVGSEPDKHGTVRIGGKSERS